MDEVLAVGDVAFQKKCLDKMKETAQKTGKTVLYVSHNMSTIRQLCNRCVVLDEGKIIFEGDTEEAIKIYLGQYANSPALVDLSGLLKLENNNSNLLIESVKLLNYKEWKIPSKSKIRFEVAIKAHKELDKICFCLHLTTLEGQIITILQSPSQFDFKENENKIITYEADLSALRPGQYCLSPELFVISEYGTRFPLNKVNMPITFEIQKSDNFIKEHELEYGKYGYVQFPEMIVL